MKKWIERIISAIALVAMSFGLAVLVMEWMAGCGESYIDSKGVRHQNECLFINR